MDDYDVPLIACLERPELFQQVQSDMSRFFMLLKGGSGSLRFLFITGITKFNSAGLFSGFNNLVDLSLDPRYGTLLGYSQEEVETYFLDYLNEAGEVL